MHPPVVERSRDRASEQDGSYPRPQLVRSLWVNLDGPWDFEFGEGDDFTRTITVPFPPESALSGIADTGYHPVLRYRRTISAQELTAAGHDASRVLLLHFGAVDYRADVWIDGQHRGSHEGGHTPFTIELPDVDAGFEIARCAPPTTRTTSRSPAASRTGSSSRTTSGTRARAGSGRPCGWNPCRPPRCGGSCGRLTSRTLVVDLSVELAGEAGDDPRAGRGR